MVDINEYFTVFPGGKASDNLFLDRNKKTILNSITNGCSKQAYVQGFYCETIQFKIALNMFECM